MKRLMIALCVAVVATMVVSAAQAAVFVFEFTGQDLWNHTPSDDSALFSQDAPRRHHTDWKTNVQTTDSGQPNQDVYAKATQAGTNGFKQTASYDEWLDAGAEDNFGNTYGIADVQLWGANFPNAKFAWGEHFQVAEGASAWQILAVPDGWKAVVAENVYSPGQYWIDWYTEDYSKRILPTTDGSEVFRFSVDIAGEYPSALEEDPDGNPFEGDGRLRIWFGGYALNPESTPDVPIWTNEGFDGIMALAPVPEPASVVVWSLLAGLGFVAVWRKRNR